MPEYHVGLTIEGLHEEGSRVRLPVLVNELQYLSGLLGRLDRHVSGGVAASTFRVVALSQSSPATMELEVVQNSGSPDTRGALVAEFTRALEKMDRGEVPVYLGRAMLEDFRNLAKPVGETLALATIKANGKSYDLTGELAKRIEHTLSGEEVCIGTVEGMLEQINLHRDANVFRIYPYIGAKVVLCTFPGNLRDLAISAVGTEVSVSGLLTYRLGEYFPHTIDVESIDIFPVESDLPTMDDLRGLAREATGDLSSEEFVGRLRDDWD